MTFTRTAKFVFVGGALAAWLAAAATTGVRYESKPVVRQLQPIDRNSVALANEIARLHERLRPDITPRQPGRNVFSFAAAKPRPIPESSTLRPALSEARAVKSPPPPLKLSGIAEDTTSEGIVRTAIISGLGQLFLVKEGEQIADRYRVVKVSAEAAELADLTDSTIIRLALK
ncbi:MAG: hypothetical protein C5B57_00065 [Blastocatellia bacterium]|nr:MAG: hypothetical protein C5B57_00065 [Blastocatellia bacterium]